MEDLEALQSEELGLACIAVPVAWGLVWSSRSHASVLWLVAVFARRRWTCLSGCRDTKKKGSECLSRESMRRRTELRASPQYLCNPLWIRYLCPNFPIVVHAYSAFERISLIGMIRFQTIARLLQQCSRKLFCITINCTIYNYNQTTKKICSYRPRPNSQSLPSSLLCLA